MSETDSRQPRKSAGKYVNQSAAMRSRVVAVLGVLTGVAFGARATVKAFGEIRYWSPETPLEHSAVALFSVATLFLGGTLWALGAFWKTHDHLPGRAAKFSRFSVGVAAIAAVVYSVSNFLEDYLLLRWFGITFIIGAIVLLLGLLCAGCARLAVTPREDKVEGILLLANAAGVLFLSFSMGVAAAAVLLLAAYHVWFRDKLHARPAA